jgi:hypothetical protein
MRITARMIERFFQKVHINIATGHWEWTGGKAGAGYALFFIRKTPKQTNIYAHRFSYLLHYGKVPKGLEINHRCDLRSCVSPFHIQAITHQQNMLLGNTIAARNASRTHCPRGHPYDEKNTRYSKNGWRMCRECHKNYYPYTRDRSS